MSVVAIINGKEITEKMLEKAVARYFIQMEEDEDVDFNPTAENMKFLRVESLNFLIERQVLLQLAEKLGMTVDNNIVENRINELRSTFEGEADWQNNLLALRISEEELDDEIRDDLVLELMLESLAKETIDMSDEALRAFFEDNQSRMKEPDLYTFYEVPLDSTEQVNTVAFILQEKSDLGTKKDKMEAFGLKLSHYADIESARMPEQVLNVLSDLEVGKMGTMLIEENQLVLYQLLKFKEGRTFDFDEIKDHLAVYLEQQARKELYAKLVAEQMEVAEIEYNDLSSIKRK